MANLDTLLQQANHFARSGEPDAAKRCLIELGNSPGVAPELLLPAAFVAFQSRDVALAEQLLRRAIDVAPEFAPAHTNLGNILREQGRLNEAIMATMIAADLTPNDPMNQANLGALQEENQRPDLAETAFREALKLAPGRPDLLDGLGRVLLKLARPSEAMTVLEQALAVEPKLVSAYVNLGNLHQTAEQLDAAAENYQQALVLEPTNISALGNLALIRSKQGRLEEAEAGFRQVTDRAPKDPIAFNNLAQLLYRKGNFKTAIEACDGALRGDPGNRDALATKVITLNEMGDRVNQSYLSNFAEFVRIERIAAIPGFADLDRFNDALFAEVNAAPDRFSEPGSDRARQTLDLMLEPGPAVSAYGQMIDHAVATYQAGLSKDPAHPFIASKPTAWRLEAWGTITKEIAAGEDCHIHPDAWLSGVYYARLPQAVSDDGNNQGCLEIGRAPNHLPQNVEPELKIIQPEPGLLVLFPSYTYHRILPFSSDTLRMSIAFDAVPV